MGIFLVFLCHPQKYALLCSVQTTKRYEAAKLAAFFVPIHDYRKVLDNTAPCREVETPPEFCFVDLNST